MNTKSPLDARAAAWVSAWNHLLAASAAIDAEKHRLAELLQRSAEVFVTLATADQRVGEQAGAVLEAQRYHDDWWDSFAAHKGVDDE